MSNEKYSRLHFFKKHKKFYFAILVIIIILIIVFRPTGPKPVEVEKVKRGDITESITATGTIASKTSVNLNFVASGKLVYLGVKKGDLVEANKTIAILDQRTLQKDLESALRDYSLQRNTFDQTQSNNLNRTPNQALNDSMKRILQDNQYNLEKAVISVELQQLAKENSVLITPIEGIVTRADVTTAGVNVSATTTFTIADPNNLVFKIDIDEADIAKVRVGANITLTLDSYPDQKIPLQITAIDFSSHTSDTGGNVYTVETLMPINTDTKYRIGMTGEAEIIVDQKKDTLIISLASVADNNFVYVRKGDSYIKRKVKTGIQSDTEIEVISGLTDGEEVALQPDEIATLLKNNKKRFFFF